MHGDAAHVVMARQVGLALLLCLWAGPAPAQESRDPYASERRGLVSELRDYGGARIDREVLQVLSRVPRHEFVPATQRRHAYDNRPLSIGYGQTISQPYIVALMTTLAQP